MKKVIKVFTIVAIMLGMALPMTGVNAKTMMNNNTDNEFHQKLAEKIRETSNGISKDIGLDQKQSEKVYQIKLEEAKAIEDVRADKNISPNDTKNKILIIKNNANSKIEKLLNKDQKVIWGAKKKNYEYNPGFIENVKDKYLEKKEDIQERREEKRQE